MAIALPIFGVAFAAYCIWLGVRIVNRRERWAKWTLLGTIVGVPVLYVLSFGPACWWFGTPSDQSFGGIGPDGLALTPDPATEARQIYWPIGWVALNGPSSIERALGWYAKLGGHDVLVPTNAKRRGWWIP